MASSADHFWPILKARTIRIQWQCFRTKALLSGFPHSIKTRPGTILYVIPSKHGQKIIGNDAKAFDHGIIFVSSFLAHLEAQIELHTMAVFLIKSTALSICPIHQNQERTELIMQKETVNHAKSFGTNDVEAFDHDMFGLSFLDHLEAQNNPHQMAVLFK